MSKAKLARLPIAATVLLSSFGIAQCIPFAEANEQIGATRCITGKVLKVEEGQAGVTYLNFCEDYRSCPFHRGGVFLASENMSETCGS